MFDNQRYVTRGVSENIPFELQMLMWIAIDNMPVKEKDYLQVFTLEPKEIGDIKMQHVKHSREMPDYVNEFDVIVVNPVRIFCKRVLLWKMGSGIILERI